MAKIEQQLLAPNEEIRYQFGIGMFYAQMTIAPFIVFGILCLISAGFITDPPLISIVLGLLGIFLIIMGLLFGHYYNTAFKYIFTNRRIIIHNGWLSTKTASLDYDKITDIRVIQDYWEKIFYQTGTLTIDTAGGPDNDEAIILKNINSPYQVKQILDTLRFQFQDRK